MSFSAIGPRVREARVAVRVVVLPHDLAHPDLVAELQPDQVVEDAAVDAAGDVAARQVRYSRAQLRLPELCELPFVVETSGDERHPTDLAFAEHDLQRLESFEQSRHEPVAHAETARSGSSSTCRRTVARRHPAARRTSTTSRCACSRPCRSLRMPPTRDASSRRRCSEDRARVDIRRTRSSRIPWTRSAAPLPPRARRPTTE